MITIDHLRYRTLAINALRIEPGITSIIGPNGSGKTTLLKLLAGITVPEKGDINIDGKTPRESEIGWVNEFPDRNILFGTVFDEIASSLRFRHIPCGEIVTIVEPWMEALGIAHLKKRTMRDLSGGEKIMVAVAAALVHRPRVLILDEYDSHLDSASISRIERVIANSDVPYVIRCTQQMETAARGDRIIFLEKGQVVSEGTPDSVFQSFAETPFYPLSWRCRT
jgi:energy-coupling factor transport system ATP-binding protein